MKFLAIPAILIITASVITAGLISATNRIENDAAFHALISREIAERQSIIPSSDRILADTTNGFPVAYPQLFHLIGAVLYPFLEEKAFTILPVLYGLVALLFFFLLVIRIFNRTGIALLSLLFLAFNTQYLDYMSKYFMEIALVFGVCASLYYAVKYAGTRTLADFLVASFFFGVTISIKQQGFFLIPAYLFLIAVVSLRHRLIHHIILGVSVFLLAVAGPLMHLFASTGSMLYAGDTPPAIVDMIEQPLRKYAGVTLLTSDPQWPLLNEGRRAEELLRWRNLPAIITAWIDDTGSLYLPWEMFALIAILGMILRLIRKRDAGEGVIAVSLISFSMLFYVLARPRYTLPLIILPPLILLYLADSFRFLPLRRHVYLLVTACVLLYTGLSFAGNIRTVAQRDNFGFMNKTFRNRESDLDDIYAAIRNTQSSDPVVLSPLPYETAYYTNRPVVWANPYGSTEVFEAFLKTETEALEVFKRYKAGFIVVYADRLLHYTNWVGINPTDGFLDTIDASPYFSAISRNQTGTVYRILYDPT